MLQPRFQARKSRVLVRETKLKDKALGTSGTFSAVSALPYEEGMTQSQMFKGKRKDKCTASFPLFAYLHFVHMERYSALECRLKTGVPLAHLPLDISHTGTTKRTLKSVSADCKMETPEQGIKRCK